MDTTPKRDKSPDTTPKRTNYSTQKQRSSESYDTRPKIRRINQRFSSWQIRDIQDSELLLRIIRIIVNKKARESKPSPIFSKMMSRIEKEIQHRPEWQKYLISGAAKYAYIGIRKGIPRFSAIEQTLEGLLKRDYQTLTKGVIELVTGETFSTFLFELIENP